MQLIKGRELFFVECHTSNCGYENDDTYIFPNEEEVNKFLGICNDYINHEYYSGKDIYGYERSLGSSEYVKDVYSQVEYEVKYE